LRPDGEHPLEQVLAVLLACALAAGVLVQVSAGAAAWLTGHGWTAIPLDAMPGGLAGIPRHLSDPRSAFRPEVSGWLPPAGLWYGTALAMLAVGVAVGRRLLDRRRADAPAARWAGRRELRRLHSPACPGRIVLGRVGGRTIATEVHQSLLVVAPTQSGKTTALAVPALLEWEGPVIACSVKTDLVRDTIRHRSHLGDVLVFDPTGSTNLSSASWTPLSGCSDWAGARRVASWLTDGAAPAKRSLTDGDFWYSAAAKLLAPLLFAASTSGHTMADVVAWVDTQEEDAVMRALEATDCLEALQAMQANWMRDERQRSSIYTTAETVLEAYADPGVLARSSRVDIEPGRVLDGGRHTVYLCAPAQEQRRLRPVFVALLQELLDAAYAASARRAGPLDPPLLVVLDEVANIAPLRDLDMLVSTAAGHGIQLVTVLQDLAQAYDRWGRDRADTLLNNHRARLFGAGISDERTLDYVARLLGDAEYRQQSTTSGDREHRSVTDSTSHRPLMPPHALRQARQGTGLLIYGTLPPTWVTMRPWYRDARLRRLGGS
jgi:type IV secretion system protein VirD4